ncbi:MAG: transposase [Mesorhizobium sp.]|uniref:tyrosine-type recombinase/integrase n=1 Tax=Mesorhizobium sp. TaxID=1871066 RepID=UPI001220C696|nr:tyrosine-type recombinase/integrase [Mesorhizobium sp.]TIQ41843.1 MAG: transposase [Mesorhizobium sp.]
MRVVRVRTEAGDRFELIDEHGVVDRQAASFARGLIGRGCSPHTVAAYLYDLRRFYNFLAESSLTLSSFKVAHSVDLLAWLGNIQSNRVRLTAFPAAVRTTLSSTSINRSMAAISSFFDHLVLGGEPGVDANPLATPQELARGGVARRRSRGARRLKRVERLPRPMSREQVETLLGVVDRPRDRAMILLMLQGGLRPGEVLNLHLDDIEYGRRRVTVRHRTDHPKGVRTKSRRERVIDLHEPEALAAVSRYVMAERPGSAPTGHIFLVCGTGSRAEEALSYAALAKLFKRRCAAAGLHDPWITPHALRHTHATWLWEGGMRELALQKRLGHASYESTKGYTRVSDAMMLEDYKRALAVQTERVRNAEAV